MLDRRHTLKVLASALLLGGAASFAEGGPETAKILRIGIVLDRPEAALRARYSPLFDKISHLLDMPHRLMTAKSEHDLARLFHETEIDLAYFSGAAFVLVHRADGAVPLVMRDVDTRHRSHILVNRNDPANSLLDTKGKRLAFGSHLSASGHLMPRYFLRERDIDPETFFHSIIYSGAPERTAEMVRDGKADVGAVNSQIVGRMLKDGRLNEFDVRILWETPNYTDRVWAVRSGLNEKFHHRLREAFLALSPDDTKDAKILKSVGAGSFLPARLDDFKQLDAIMAQLGLRAG